MTNNQGLVERVAVLCFSCPGDFLMPATHIATVPHKDGGGKVSFGAPLCQSHSIMALIAGWNPIYEISSPEGQKLWDEHGWKNPALLKDTTHGR